MTGAAGELPEVERENKTKHEPLDIHAPVLPENQSALFLQTESVNVSECRIAAGEPSTAPPRPPLTRGESGPGLTDGRLVCLFVCALVHSVHQLRNISRRQLPRGRTLETSELCYICFFVPYCVALFLSL